MNVERVPVGDGTPEGTNSAYLLADRGVVIDPGPPTDRAWADLEVGLDRTGLTVEDLEYVLVTHWHADHAGLAPRLAEVADATLAMGADDAPLIGEYGTERRRRLERDAATLADWGVPEEAIEAVTSGDAPSPIPDRFPVEPLEDGDAVGGLEALATPGHTVGHTSFVTDDAVIVGDAVLPTYTPNVGGSDTRTRGDDPLGTFLETGDRLEALAETHTLLPGHGTRLDADRIATIREHHRGRSERVRNALETRGEATPWELACDLFGDLEGIHVKFGAGEAAAHLERLEADGVLERGQPEPGTYRSV